MELYSLTDPSLRELPDSESEDSEEEAIEESDDEVRVEKHPGNLQNSKNKHLSQCVTLVSALLVSAGWL